MNEWMGELRARFRLRAARDLERLPALIADASRRKELEGLIHSTAGTAGTFGFDELSQAAMVVDDCYARSETPDEAAFQRLAEAFVEVAHGNA